MNEELKPCPFCGGEAIVSFDPDGTKDTKGRKWAYTVLCNNCCATSGLCWSNDMAMAAWNRRANDGKTY